MTDEIKVADLRLSLGWISAYDGTAYDPNVKAIIEADSVLLVLKIGKEWCNCYVWDMRKNCNLRVDFGDLKAMTVKF